MSETDKYPSSISSNINDPDIIKNLKDFAEKEKRTTNNALRYLLELGIEVAKEKGLLPSDGNRG